ncbi:hypothetical protein ACFQVD_06280 [Streptosporangium amethystogenes subsp. fukuiense]|uniref:Uncharacterized protein n=1 Tax=Streptosporangium amethystogenes subsp. fukuiense TaxID=698418 RepID=A0ABW2SU14_9ACTN
MAGGAGGPATLVLDQVRERRLGGSWLQAGTEPYGVSGEIDADDPLPVRLDIDVPKGPARFTGSIFSRPKNALAGWIDTTLAWWNTLSWANSWPGRRGGSSTNPAEPHGTRYFSQKYGHSFSAQREVPCRRSNHPSATLPMSSAGPQR